MTATNVQIGKRYLIRINGGGMATMSAKDYLSVVEILYFAGLVKTATGRYSGIVTRASSVISDLANKNVISISEMSARAN